MKCSRHALITFVMGVLACGSARAVEPASVKIKEVRRLEHTVARLGGDGDNWHMSWAGDDRVVAGLCDGAAQPWPNVPHRLFNSRMIAIHGVAPKLEFADTPGYPELLVGPTPRETSRYYGFGVLAMGGKIYQFEHARSPVRSELAASALRRRETDLFAGQRRHLAQSGWYYARPLGAVGRTQPK